MAKKQLVELVMRLKKSGIKISFTKPRSKYSIHLQQNKKLPTISH